MYNDPDVNDSETGSANEELHEQVRLERRHRRRPKRFMDIVLI